METHTFSGTFTQTLSEKLYDRKRMKKLKKNIEKAFSGCELVIEDASEWNEKWRIPLLFHTAHPEIRDVHFKVVAGYGADLCFAEQFSDKNKLFVEFKKKKKCWRKWSWTDQIVLFSSILGMLGSLGILLKHVKTIYD